MTILWERIQFYQVQVKTPGFVEDYPEKADHYSKQIESLSEMMFTLLSQYNPEADLLVSIHTPLQSKHITNS